MKLKQLVKDLAALCEVEALANQDVFVGKKTDNQQVLYVSATKDADGEYIKINLDT